MLRAAKVIPVRVNLALVVFFLTLNIVQFLVLPAFLLPLDPMWGLILVPIALTTPTFWALVHESFHGLMHPDVKTNRVLGRILCIFFGSPWRLLRFAHLMHHKMSRTSYDCVEVYDPNKTSWGKAALKYYPNLLMGMYVSELSALILLWLPERYVRPLARHLFGSAEKSVDTGAMAEKAICEHKNLREQRLDCLGTVLLFALAFYLYGAWWPMLLAALVGRGLLISILDNAPHYGTPMNDTGFSYNLGLSGKTARLWLNFNLHRVHHQYPSVPWRQLPDYFDKTDGTYDGHFVRIVGQQFKGPLLAPSRPLTQPIRHPEYSFIE
ncbi:fatty acid desaturase [Aestuariispira insulae]|uniref:Fatty acid desaturase n=1 Tax=Aestuariispira insulae TaxID=1461337 RepID=A0A3D9HS15_9PROT|nr:fatty acid desaturase [Aestuariispira insulae]RED52121.1 fatty acid desaturase [Aestuariispira insulae]